MKKVITLLLVLQIQAIADVKCDNALHTCMDYAQTLQDGIKIRDSEIDKLGKTLKKEEEPLMPWWSWAIIGAVVGGLVIHEVNK